METLFLHEFEPPHRYCKPMILADSVTEGNNGSYMRLAFNIYSSSWCVGTSRSVSDRFLFLTPHPTYLPSVGEYIYDFQLI